MKKFIMFLCLIGLFTSCEDELIDFYEEPIKEEIIINETESRTDSINNESEEKLYPIGFTVTVNDFKEE